MKREDVEAGGGENLVRYRKEPSGCPVCGKVTRVGAGPGTQLTFFSGKPQRSTHCTRGRGGGEGVGSSGYSGVLSHGVPSLGALVHLRSCRQVGSPVKELSLVSAWPRFATDAARVRMFHLQCPEPGTCGGGGGRSRFTSWSVVILPHYFQVRH